MKDCGSSECVLVWKQMNRLKMHKWKKAANVQERCIEDGENIISKHGETVVICWSFHCEMQIP